MIKNQNTISLTLLLLIQVNFHGCTSFLKRFENFNPDTRDQLVKVKLKDLKSKNFTAPKLYCQQETQKHLFIGNNRSMINQLNQFFEKTPRLTFIDKVNMYTLAQLNLRVDLSSPQSRFQTLIKDNNSYYYYDFSSPHLDAFPVFYGMEFLREKFKSNYSIKQLITFLSNKKSQFNFLVDKELEDFFSYNYGNLSAYPGLEKNYIRGEETLQENEIIPNFPIMSLYKKFEKDKKIKKDLLQDIYTVSEKLYTYNKIKELTINCNYDMSLYDNSIFLIHENIIRSNVFGLATQENLFWGVHNLDIINFSPLQETAYIQGVNQTLVTPFCIIKNKKLNTDIVFVSSSERDPGQHLHHLLSYGLKNLSLRKTSKLIQYSRHLFLSDPLRLSFESHRSSNKQLEELLTLNFPIYHADSLGKIWGSYDINNQKSFLLDPRRIGHINCPTTPPNN